MPTTEKKTKKVTLDNDVQVNGQKFAAGTEYEVSEAQAADLVRIDKEHSRYLANLNKNNAESGSLGSVSAA